MKQTIIGYTNVNFTFEASIQVKTPASGFLFQLGQTGDPFFPIISFSGNSGYIFDQSGNFFGGYIKNEQFSISGNYFFGDYVETGNLANDHTATGRLSYYFNNTLIANDIKGTGFIDALRFEDYNNQNSLIFNITFDTGSSDGLMDSNGLYLLSSEGFYLN